MLRVAMIVWNDFQNDARVLKEAQTLQAAGYDVTVHALHTPGVTCEQEVLTYGVKVVRVARSPFWHLRKKNDGPSVKTSSGAADTSLLKQLLRMMSRSFTHMTLFYKMLQSKPDIVHAHDVNTLPTAYLVSLFARAPLVYDAHEVSTGREGYASFRTLVYYVEKYLMPRAAATITTTTTRAKFFSRTYQVPRPLVLQNRPRLITLEKTAKIRDALKLEKDQPIVLYQGGLQQGRGLERLIDAAAQVDNAYFVFIGGGRLEPVLKDKVKQLKLEHVYFIPTVTLDDLPHYTASADIGVQVLENTCFNHYSTDSNKLFEYIIAGLPIIASRFPEISHVVRTYDLGLLVAPGNLTDLVSALRTLIADPALRLHYHQQALIAAQQLNWEEQENALLDLYKKIETTL